MESIYNAVRHLERQSEPVRGKKKQLLSGHTLTAEDAIKNCCRVRVQLRRYTAPTPKLLVHNRHSNICKQRAQD